MKKILLIWFVLLTGIIQAQITLIPDSEFEIYLSNLGYDSDGEINGQVFTSDIDMVTDLAFLNNYTITDLTGIEDFVSLEYLRLGRLDITQLNISNNINLDKLSIGDVSLESISLESNINLRDLIVNINCPTCIFTSTITELDVTNNLLLESLWFVDSNTITELDLSSNTNISDLRINNADGLTQINLKSGDNTNINFLRIKFCDNLICVQVDDPAAVIAGTDPPYDSWIIEDNPLVTITDDCNLGLTEYLENQISIYPNPVLNVLYLGNNSGYSIHTLQVYDVLGRLVLQESNPSRQLDVSNLTSGLLFVQIETDKGIITKKVIKE